MTTSRKEEYLSPNALEEQEHLSKKRLSALAPIGGYPTTTELRPTANYIDLMNWAVEGFQDALKDKRHLQKFVHNRIIIDGQFMQFAEENDIKITCLYKDSIISWETEHDFEKFFAQGAFLIERKSLELLHFSLWERGNQNEDEVSFFIVCSEKNYEGYIQLRNEFDKWVLARDRSNLHIRVVEGDDLPYTKDHTWEDLFLPDSIKSEIRFLVENFLASKEFYQENKIPWKRGMLLFGHAGCGKSSIIRTIISMYPFKPITVVAGANEEVVREAFAYAEEQSPALLYFEDLDSLLERSLDPSSFLNLMDGISSKNGLLVIATANEVRKLKANITDRPSRFDRKFAIPLPNAEMAYIYLKKWFGNRCTAKQCRDLAKYAERHGFSYAYLKELYVSTMHEALSHNRETPTPKDIQDSLDRLIKDKHLLNGGTVNMDKYIQKG